MVSLDSSANSQIMNLRTNLFAPLGPRAKLSSQPYYNKML